MPAFQLADDLIPAIGYIRVSMAREEMISPELQRTAILNWAKRTGHRIIDWVEDLDKTGRNFRRRIMDVIERVEAGEARVIAVWKYSRFGRTRTGVPANLARVEKAGAQLLSATEEVDARTAIGRFQRGMIMEFNAFESDRAGEQWEETHKWRRDHGLPASGRPRVGYIWHPRKTYQPDGAIILQEERYEPDPTTSGFMAEAYRRYIAGEGFKQLAVWLNAHGVPTVRGGPWWDAALRRYMDSGFAAGYLRVHDPACTEPYRSECPNHLLIKHPENHHPAIITEAEWEQYKARRSQVQATAPRARKATYPLTGLVRCGLCGGSARRKVTYTKYAYFICNRRKTMGPSACAGAAISVGEAEAWVRGWLTTVSGEIAVDANGLPAPTRALDLIDRQERELEQLRAQHDRLERAVAKHMRTYAMSDEDDPDGCLERAYLDTLRDLREERAAVACALAEAEETAAGGESQAMKLRATVMPMAKELLAEWATLRPEKINVLLRQVLRYISVHPGKELRAAPAWEPEPPLGL